jgi:DNA-binding NtrC family response regulator
MANDLGDVDDAATDFHPRAALAPRPTSFVLEVIDGPDAGLSLTLDPDEPLRVLVGQGPACQFRVTDSEVSRRHAALEVTGHRLRVTDLGSTNGTTVNGITITDAFVQGGETLRLGSSTVLRVRRADPAPTRSDAASPRSRFGFTIGESPEMQRLYPLCERLAASDVPVVIEGETGTGKEMLAESLHNMSTRASGPFVVFDCTAVPGNLMESELFGHEKGAFTGAAMQRKGMFEQADGGTLLIDEIGDLDTPLQSKLLRAVERREIRRLGGNRAIRVDVRLLAATRRDLDREVQAGRFRDDLFHRLAVTRIELPPLRKRKHDIRVLVRHFCSEFGVDVSVVPPEVLSRWEDAAWPGNVRELRNSVARWIAIGELEATKHTGADAVPGDPISPVSSGVTGGDMVEQILALRLPLTQARQRLVENFEQRYIEKMLAEHGGHVGRAAAASGIGRRYFQMLIARRSGGGDAS